MVPPLHYGRSTFNPPQVPMVLKALSASQSPVITIDPELKPKRPRTALGRLTALVEAGPSLRRCSRKLRAWEAETQKLAFPPACWNHRKPNRHEARTKLWEGSGELPRSELALSPPVGAGNGLPRINRIGTGAISFRWKAGCRMVCMIRRI